ncbi:hypothetical protein CGLO_15179 [Colletotrichum gloeosporioides Cg-14]|uniref:Uncharacterized protein n=1 Tax=Colletotrichum gloeosporioides (strain Cg-14) TaxID=1237896 RepID=T0LC60_COLGC|nr:hypothetical protein CGLO_15179 [Colletotrichum gloeosporioides Cg-14]
MLRRQLEEDG